MRSSPLVVLLLAALVQACAPASPPPPAPKVPLAPAAPMAPAATVVTVNGVAITEAEVAIAKGGQAAGGSPDEQRRATIDALVRDEIVRQRAVALGLEQDASYVEEVRRAEAQLMAAKRRLLAELWARKELEALSTVTEADARQYYTEHEAQFRTEYHVLHLMVRDEQLAGQLRKEIAAGADFEAVAARQLPGTPAGAKPWDMGFLGFAQMPEPWKAVVPTLKAGQTSEVVHGTRNRHWLLHVREIRAGASVDVEKILPVLRNTLKAARLETARAKAETDLRAGAKIEYPPAK